jgi:hypothetical protein
MWLVRKSMPTRRIRDLERDWYKVAAVQAVADELFKARAELYELKGQGDCHAVTFKCHGMD